MEHKDPVLGVGGGGGVNHGSIQVDVYCVHGLKAIQVGGTQNRGPSDPKLDGIN